MENFEKIGRRKKYDYLKYSVIKFQLGKICGNIIFPHLNDKFSNSNLID